MVDTYGRWFEENDYSTYPKEKWCDYDEMAVWIRNNGYTPQTTMENLITMIFVHYESECETENKNFSLDDCKYFVESSGGIGEFDYEP